MRCALATDSTGSKTDLTALQVLRVPLEGKELWFWRANKEMSWFKHNSDPDYLRSREEWKEERKNAKGTAKGRSKGDSSLRQQEHGDPWGGYKNASRGWNDWGDWSK